MKGRLTLQERITERLNDLEALAGSSLPERLRQESKKRADSGAAKNAPREGTTAPDFALPDQNGTLRRLSALLQRGPVVLVFYRGGWDPISDLQLRAYQDLVPAFNDRSATLVAISPQTAEYARRDVEEKGLGFLVLSDAHNRVAEAYGIAYALSDSAKELQHELRSPLPKFNGEESWRVPLPATFVIDRTGVVRFAHVELDDTQRLEPTALLDALRKVSSARPAFVRAALWARDVLNAMSE